MTVMQWAFILPAFAIKVLSFSFLSRDAQRPVWQAPHHFMCHSRWIFLFPISRNFHSIGFGCCDLFLYCRMAVGSTFSLGISYMTDLLPKHLPPAGNLMCGMAFSAGSILGPVLGGIFVQTFEGMNLLTLSVS
ncbi:hypothetical protein ACEQPO_06040 [Bacillus sp. SL00103]